MNAWKEIEPLLNDLIFLEADIHYSDEAYWDEDEKALKVYEWMDTDNIIEFTTNDFKEFKDKMSKIDYDDGFGMSMLHGTVCCKNANDDPVWFTRRDYDGSEWWVRNSVPDFYKTI